METNLVYTDGSSKTQKNARFTEEATHAFAGFVSATTLSGAVASLLPILGKRILEPKKANAGIWEGTFEFENIYFSKGEEANYKKLMKEVKPGQTAVVHAGGAFVVVTHVPDKHEWGGCVEAHIRFSKGTQLQ